MLEQHTKSDLHNGFHMETTAKLSDNGRLDSKTDIWSTNDGFGFTGAVIVFLLDADGNILFRSRAHTAGVNGVRLGDPSNNILIEEDVPQDFVKHTVKLDILHIRAPHSRIEENLDEAIKVTKKISELIKNVGDIIGEVMDIG